MRKLLRAIRDWFIKGSSLKEQGYPSLEQLRESGIDPCDFYLWIRFGIPIPGRAYSARAPFADPGEPPHLGSCAVKPKEAA